MQWRGRRQSGNVIDRRGAGGTGGTNLGRGVGLPGGFGRSGGGLGGLGGIGGGGAGGLLLLVVVIGAIFLFGNPFGEDTSTTTPSGTTTGANDDMREFVAVVLADTEDTWNGIFRAQGLGDYPEPQLVLYTGGTQTACGYGSATMGPFYCPGDNLVYLDLSFFQELEREFGAPGDFAEAYVIAHEVGHHVQNLTGVFARVDQMSAGLSEAERNQLSVRTELQADCYAGMFAAQVQSAGYLEAGDVEEALNAAQQIGDDTIQRRTQGYVVPESFNHGTSAQRMTWFRNGMNSGGRMAACDTFSGGI